MVIVIGLQGHLGVVFDSSAIFMPFFCLAILMSLINVFVKANAPRVASAVEISGFEAEAGVDVTSHYDARSFDGDGY